MAQTFPLGSNPQPLIGPDGRPMATPGMPPPAMSSAIPAQLRGPAGPVPAPAAPLPPQLGGQGPDPASFVAQLSPEQRSQLEAKRGSMSPEAWGEYITSLTQNFTEMGADAQSDMSRADALRQDTPEGRTTSGGRYQSANVLEHLSQVLNNRKRQGEYDTGRGQREDARTRADAVRAGAASDYADRQTSGY